MEKICPRCGGRFECRHEDVARCACSGLRLDASQRAWLRKEYGEQCLCLSCMEAIVRQCSENIAEK